MFPHFYIDDLDGKELDNLQTTMSAVLYKRELSHLESPCIALY